MIPKHTLRFLLLLLGLALVVSAATKPSETTDLGPPINDEDFFLKLKREIKPHLDFYLQQAGKGVDLLKAHSTIFLAALPALIPSVLTGIGFTPTGIAANSIAAYIQSHAGNVAARGVFAHLQSFSMGGYAVPVFAAAGKVYIAVIAVAVINELLLEYGVLETDLRLVAGETWKTIPPHAKEVWGSVEPGAAALWESTRDKAGDAGNYVKRGYQQVEEIVARYEPEKKLDAAQGKLKDSVEGIKKWFGDSVMGGFARRQTEHQEL